VKLQSYGTPQSNSKPLNYWPGMIRPLRCLSIPFLLFVALLLMFVIAAPAFAIALPDSTPQVIGKWVWQSVIDPGDILIIIYENTPYATPPATDYSEAFTWEFMNTTGNVSLGWSDGYDYNDKGYGYNVIGIYFSAAEVVSKGIIWGDSYYLKLNGSPVAFADPPQYIYQITASDYTTLTDPDEIQIEIEDRITQIAADLDNKWGLGLSYSLIDQSETGIVLSIYGEAFFRGALYGIQSYAPDLFRVVISNIDSSSLSDRSWSDNYSSNLTTQYAGTDIETGMNAGNDFLDVSYNLFGLIITLAIMAIIVIASLIIGGDWWGSFVGCIAPAVICTRLGLFGMGELALIAAICWLFLSAKVWKII
jgi:hypothetical protein